MPMLESLVAPMVGLIIASNLERELSLQCMHVLYTRNVHYFEWILLSLAF